MSAQTEWRIAAKHKGRGYDKANHKKRADTVSTQGWGFLMSIFCSLHLNVDYGITLLPL